MTKQKFSPMPAMDLVGDICVLDMQLETEEKKQEIIEAIFTHYHQRIKVIANKAGKICGEYRIQPLEIIFGEDRLLTTHKEFDCTYSLDLSKVFFSSRLAYERKRIADLIQPDENVLVCFAGVGPFAIIASKHSQAKEIVGIEINEDAHSFFEKNISLNKCKNVRAIKGDVREVLADSRWAGWADRIIMPHPFSDTKFLDSALRASKDLGFIHYYNFGHRNDVFENTEKYLTDSAKKNGCKLQILSKKIVRPCAAGIVHVVFDLKKSTI
jgi:tRNA (guanine37-N1)-methyltransferase